MMGDRLPMRCDQVDALDPNARLGSQLEGRLREALSEQYVERGQLPQGLSVRNATGCERMDARLKLGLERKLVKVAQPERPRVRAVWPLDERRIDTVRGGTTHEADYQQRELRPSQASPAPL